VHFVADVRIAQAALGALLACACESPIDDPREIEIVSVITRADRPLTLNRSALVAGKYRLMAADPYAFFRGTFPLYLHDVEAGDLGGETSPYFRAVSPYSVGDAHVENFGTLLGGDGALVVETNDLDGADRYPYLIEVRRLAISAVVATRLSNPDDQGARSVAIGSERENALALARSYADTMRALAAGVAREPIEDAAESPVLADLFDRAEGDLEDRSELAELTILEDGNRRLVRGSVDEDVPENVYVDVPAVVASALPGAIDRYRATLDSPPAAEFFGIKDAVREFGSGVASWPRVRFILLVEGPSKDVEDDILLEVKEIGDSGARPATFETVNGADIRERILRARGYCWTRPNAEPLWGMTDLLGLSMQIKLESEAHKTLRVRRLEEDLGTPEALLALSTDLGRMLANVHAGSEALEPGLLRAIADAVGSDTGGFAEEQSAVAIAYADQVLADHARFAHALDVLGPTLGVTPGDADGHDPDAAALIGTPPEAPE